MKALTIVLALATVGIWGYNLGSIAPALYYHPAADSATAAPAVTPYDPRRPMQGGDTNTLTQLQPAAAMTLQRAQP